MSRGATIRLCPHCLELTATLHACGETIEATSQHYAMALVRSMRAEGRSLAELLPLLELLEHAPELEPAVKWPAAAVPYRVLMGRGEQNV